MLHKYKANITRGFEIKRVENNHNFKQNITFVYRGVSNKGKQSNTRGFAAMPTALHNIVFAAALRSNTTHFEQETSLWLLCAARRCFEIDLNNKRQPTNNKLISVKSKPLIYVFSFCLGDLTRSALVYFMPWVIQ